MFRDKAEGVTNKSKVKSKSFKISIAIDSRYGIINIEIREGVINMNKELKKAILKWLLENENNWQRLNACTKEFRNYIYDDEGNYLIGGKDVSDFIDKADDLIYK